MVDKYRINESLSHTRKYLNWWKNVYFNVSWNKFKPTRLTIAASDHYAWIKAVVITPYHIYEQMVVIIIRHWGLNVNEILICNQNTTICIQENACWKYRLKTADLLSPTECINTRLKHILTWNIRLMTIIIVFPLSSFARLIQHQM